MQAANGYLYGMTHAGGLNGGGTIFRINTDGTTFKVLYHFNTTSGNNALGGLMQATNGRLYGINQNAGFFFSGTIFSLNEDGSDFKVLFTINDRVPVKSGSFARGNLVQGPDGFLYGTLMQGGANQMGVLFKINTDGTGFSKIVEFNGIATGRSPASTPLIGSDGKIYGLTQAGGVNNLGAVYSLNIEGTGFKRLLDFDGTEKGSGPSGELIEGSDGLMYGMTGAGGTNSMGTIFSINKNGSDFNKIMDLDSRANKPVFGKLVESSNGVFFGTTFQWRSKKCWFHI